MKDWVKQLVGTLLVLALGVAASGFVLILRSNQNGLASTMAAANLRAVSPPDGANNVPVSGEIRAEYSSQPKQAPTIKLEPPPGVTLVPGRWDGSTFVINYSGLRDNSLYHVDLDQDNWTGKGDHKQIEVRWSFRTGSLLTATPTAKPNLYYVEVTWQSTYAAGVFTYTFVTYYVATTSRSTYDALLSQDGSGNGGWAVTTAPGIPAGWELTCARDKDTTAWATIAPGYRLAAHQFCDGTFSPGQSP